MIISIPLTSNMSVTYSSILFKWKAERDDAKAQAKEKIVESQKLSWWNRFRKYSDDELFKNTQNFMNQHWWTYHEAGETRRQEIASLTGLLAADKLAFLTQTTATYELDPHLVSALNEEIHNVQAPAVL